MRALIVRAKTLIEKHERLLSGTALLFGFIVDSLTLRRIDLLIENLVLISYILLAGLCIVLLAHRERNHEKHRILAWGITIAPFVLQIAFGALFSAFVVFYVRSASLSASWPLILFLLFMLVGNEVFRTRYERMVFHVSVLYVALLSYSLMLVPIIVRSIGALEFIGGIALSLALVAVFVVVLRLIAPRDVSETAPRLMFTVGAISIACMLAYITNVIPPVPLTLSDSAVAHWMTRVGDSYELHVEPRTLASTFSLSEDYHRTPGEPVFVWTSVFAPARLSTSIVHKWQRLIGSRWETENTVLFPITGGRDDGYRGYSVKENITPGAWRVSVETREGLVIGRVRFDVIESDTSVRLIQLTK